MHKIEYLYDVLKKFSNSYFVKYEYDNIGIIKKFRIDSRKNLDIDEEKWCEFFLKKSCLNYCAKFLLIRFFEDRDEIASKLNQEGINIWNRLVKNIKDRYDKLFDIAIIDIKNEEEDSIIKSIFAESDYDIYTIDKELAQIIIDGFSDMNFEEIDNRDIIEVFRKLYPLDAREEINLYDFYEKAPALDYILELK